jgi:hypothetical protein
MRSTLSKTYLANTVPILTTAIQLLILCIGSGFAVAQSDAPAVRTVTKPRAVANDQFGVAATAFGENFIVGAGGDDTGARDAGALFLVNGESGRIMRTISNPDPKPSDRFGSVLATSGQVVVVGVPNKDAANSADAGAVYIYSEQLDRPLVIANPTPALRDNFGFAVAAGRGTILIGAPRDDLDGTRDAGVAYLFNRESGDLVRRLHAPVLGAGDQFGASVALLGDLAIVGAPRSDAGSRDAGVVYVFSVESGELLHTLQRREPAASDFFGTSVAAAGENLVIGAPGLDLGDVRDAGAAYVFNTKSGELVRALHHPEPVTRDQFGIVVATAGQLAFVGSPFSDLGRVRDAGSVHVFDTNTGQPRGFLHKPEPTTSDQLGRAIAAGPAGILIGAPLDDASARNAGAAYLFAVDRAKDEETASGEDRGDRDDETSSDREGDRPADGDGDERAGTDENRDQPEDGQRPSGDDGNVADRDEQPPSDRERPDGDDRERPEMDAAFDRNASRTLAMPQARGLVGSTIPIPVVLNLAPRLIAASFDISFDATKLSVAEDAVHRLPVTGDMLLQVDSQPGKLAVGLAGVGPLTGVREAILVVIPFKINEDANATAVGDIVALEFSEASLLFDAGEIVTITPKLQNGRIEIVALDVTPGDVDQDGELTMADVVAILRLGTGRVDVTPFVKAIADVNKDGRIGVADALAVMEEIIRAKTVPQSPTLESVKVDIPEVEMLAGTPFSLPVTFSGGSVRGVDMLLRYDPEGMRLLEVSPARKEGTVVVDHSVPGIIRLAGVNPGGFEEFVKIDFEPFRSGAHQLQLEEAHLFSGSETSIALRSLRQAPLPDAFQLLANFPNPFNPETTIRYSIAEPSMVRISVHNLAGQLVEMLVNQPQRAGRHEITWRAVDLTSGIYLLVVDAGGTRRSMKMMLLK